MILLSSASLGFLTTPASVGDCDDDSDGHRHGRGSSADGFGPTVGATVERRVRAVTVGALRLRIAVTVGDGVGPVCTVGGDVDG